MNEYLLFDFRPYEVVHDSNVRTIRWEGEGPLPIRMRLALCGGPTSIGEDVAGVDRPDTTVELLAKVLDDLQGDNLPETCI